MKSSRHYLLFSLLFLLGLIGCTNSNNSENSKNSGDGQSGTNESIETLIDFNGLDELTIKIKKDAEIKLENDLITSFDVSDILNEIEGVESNLLLVDSKLREKKQLLQKNITKINETNSTIFELKESLQNKEIIFKDYSQEEIIVPEQLINDLENATKERNEKEKEYNNQQKITNAAKKQLHNIQMNKDERSLVDSIFEYFKGGSSEQTETLESQVLVDEQKLKELAKKLKEKLLSQRIKKQKIEEYKNKIRSNNRQHLQRLEPEISLIKTQIENLNKEKNTLEVNKSSILFEIKKLEDSKIANDSLITSLRDKKSNLVSLDTLKEGNTAAALKLKVIQSLKENKLSIKQIITALIAVHNESRSELQITNDQMIAEFTSLTEMVSSEAIDELKPTYENILATEKHGGELLTYNKENYNVTDLIIKNKMQCYSGTLFFNMINELSSSAFKNTVVIFTNGHILPGYIEKEGEKVLLKGIETTAAGKAIVLYGETKDIAGNIRVFDAKQFLLAELLKKEIADFSDVYNQMLKTVEKYKFNPDQFYSLDTAVSKKINSNQLNVTPFGFGNSNTPAGDQTRESFDEKQIADFNSTSTDKSQHEGKRINNDDSSTDGVPYCNILKPIFGSETLLNFEAQCLDDKSQIISLSSYIANPINNSASITYSLDGYKNINYLLDDNNSVCTVYKGKHKSSFKLDLNLNYMILENANNTFMQAVMSTKAPIDPMELEMIEFFESIYINTKNKLFVKKINELKLQSTSNVSHEITREDTEASLTFRGATYKLLEENKCHVSARNLLLNEISEGVLRFGFGTPEKGIQLEINCPELHSSRQKINEVKIKVNCQVSEQVYSY